MRIDTSEANILKILMLKLSKNKVTIFRNNVGTGWVGKVRKVIKPGTVLTDKGFETIKPGDLVISEPRPFNAGLCKGSSDLIGWKSIEITPEMVNDITPTELRSFIMRKTTEANEKAIKEVFNGEQEPKEKPARKIQ